MMSQMVESRIGAVAWGLLANAPFPIPAHRTGRADFRHPALRLDSSHVVRYRVPWLRINCQWTKMHAAQAQHAVGPEDFSCGEPAGATRSHLVPPTEEVAHPVVDVVVNGPVGHQARPVAEVRGPATQHRVEPV